MASEGHQRLLNALANELEDMGVVITHLARRGMREPFDMQYWDLEEPPARGGKIPDLQGEKSGSIHLGEADTSLYSSHTASQLDTFVRYVVRNPSFSLHVAVPFERKHYTKDKILPMAGRNDPSKIWVWPFREVGRTYIPEPKLRVR